MIIKKTREELLEEVTNLMVVKGLVVSNKITISDQYSYTVIGSTLLLSVKEFNDKRIFKNIMNWGERMERTYDLDYTSSLELLFNHYQYGITNGANSFLLNGNREILAVNWHGLEYNDNIAVVNTIHPGYFIFNNSKKIEYKIKYSDIKKYEKDFNTLLKIYK